MERAIRLTAIYVGLVMTIYGVHGIDRPILFLIGAGILSFIGERSLFGGDLFLVGGNNA